MKRMNEMILRFSPRMEKISGRIMNVKDYEWDDIEKDGAKLWKGYECERL